MPQTGLGNVMVDGQDVRTWRREEDTLIVSLHQPVMGAYTLLVTFEEKPRRKRRGIFKAGQIVPLDVQSENAGTVQVVSPMQVEITHRESRLRGYAQARSTGAPRRVSVCSAPRRRWERGSTRNAPLICSIESQLVSSLERPLPKIVEFSEANSRVSQRRRIGDRHCLLREITPAVEPLKVKLPR